jgi:hypothetical protein
MPDQAVSAGLLNAGMQLQNSKEMKPGLMVEMNKVMPSERATVAPDLTIANEIINEDFKSVNLTIASEEFKAQQLAMRRNVKYHAEEEEEEAEDDFE